MRLLPLADLHRLPLTDPAFTASEMAPHESVDGLDLADDELLADLTVPGSAAVNGPEDAWRDAPDGPRYGAALRTLLAHRDKRASQWLQGLGVVHNFAQSPFMGRWRAVVADRSPLPVHALLRLGGHKAARGILASAATAPEELGTLFDRLDNDMSPTALREAVRGLRDLPDAMVNGVLGLGDTDTGLEGYALADVDGGPVVYVAGTDGVDGVGDPGGELYGLGDVGGWYSRYRKREKRRLKNAGKTIARNLKKGARMVGNFIKNSARIVGGALTGNAAMIGRGVRGHADGAKDVANRITRAIDRKVNPGKYNADGTVKRDDNPFDNAVTAGMKPPALFGRPQNKMPDEPRQLDLQAKNAAPPGGQQAEEAKTDPSPTTSGEGGGMLLALGAVAIAAVAMGGKTKRKP